MNCKVSFSLFYCLLCLSLNSVAQADSIADDECNCQLSYSDGMQKVIKDGKYGFRDSTGTLIIPYLYDYTMSFYRNRCIVAVGNKMGIIDNTGQIILPFEWDLVSVLESAEYYRIQKESMVGIASRDGKIIIQPDKYEYIFQPSDGLMLAGNSVAAYTIEKTIGFINMNGDTVIPFRYSFAIPFSEGFAVVASDRYTEEHVDTREGEHSHADENGIVRTHSYNYGIIDTKGRTVLPLEYDMIYPFKEGLALIKMGGKFGFIDKKMKNVTGFIYDEATPFREGLARVKKNGKWGFVNKKGKEMVPCQYDFVRNFDQDLAHVMLNDKNGFINKKGKEVIPLIYDTDKLLQNEYGFRDGLSMVYKNYKYGFIDRKGNVVIPIRYPNVRVFSEGLAVVREKGSVFYLNTKGEMAIPFYFKTASPFYWGRAEVSDPGESSQSYYINKQGKCVRLCKNRKQ